MINISQIITKHKRPIRGQNMVSNTSQAESGQRRPVHGLKQLTSCPEVGVASSNMKTLIVFIIESQQTASNIKENDPLLRNFSLMTSAPCGRWPPAELQSVSLWFRSRRTCTLSQMVLVDDTDAETKIQRFRSSVSKLRFKPTKFCFGL